MRRTATRSARSRSCRDPGAPARPVGSRLPLAYAQETGANFLTAGALDAARARTSVIEPHQSFDHQRLWADLLSSPAMAFNLFGDLAADLGLADRAVHTWWPDAPGTVCDVRFAHSPGRFDPAYLNSLRAFDVAFVLDLGDGTQGIVGVDVKYHERAKPETPKPSNLPAVSRGRREVGRLQAGGDRRGQGAIGSRRDVARAPAAAVDAPASERHVDAGVATSSSTPPATRTSPTRAPVTEALLADRSTFASMTVEELLDADVLPARTTAALRKRYLTR